MTPIQGTGISIIIKQLHAAVVSLDEVGASPEETYGDICYGLTMSSNEDFKAVQHHLTQERIHHFTSYFLTQNFIPSMKLIPNYSAVTMVSFPKNVQCTCITHSSSRFSSGSVPDIAHCIAVAYKDILNRTHPICISIHAPPKTD